MGRIKMAKAMVSNNSVLVTGIQKVGYRAGTPFGFQYKTVVPAWALEVAARRAYVADVTLVRARAQAQFPRIKVRKRIGATPPDYQ